MWVFVDTKFGETFSFDDLIYQSRVSDVKRRIEKSRGIPVSTQRLFFNGVELLKDNQLYAYRIRKNSRLLLEVRDDHVNNQMPQQSPYAIQGFVPSTSMASSNYGQVPPSHAASASFFNQDPRTMARSNQVLPPSHASEAFFNQDRLVSSDGQVIHQPDVLASFSADEFLARPPLPWTAQETKKMDGSWPETRGDHNVNIQDLSPQPPQKLTVTMTQYDKPGRDFLVDVNSSDNVKELRKQLEKYQLDLPAKGYFFLHKEMRVLDDEKSFSMNRVANGDTIVIVPEHGPIEDFYT